MANRVVPDRYGVINIGKLKENLVTEVSLPAPGFAGGSYAVLLRRPKEEQPYPVSVRHDGSKLVWTVQTADTAIAGMGKLECRWYGDNGEVAKSQTYAVRITDGLPDPTEAPEAWAGFMQQVSRDAGRAESAADRAEALEKGYTEALEKARAAAEDAWQGKVSAEKSAKEAKADAQRAETAASTATQAAQVAHTAQGAAGQAAQAALTAKKAAEQAQTGAQEAKTEAEAARNDAQTAKTAAEEAAKAAQGAASTAQTAANTAQGAAAAAGNAQQSVEALASQVQVDADKVAADKAEAQKAAGDALGSQQEAERQATAAQEAATSAGAAADRAAESKGQAETARTGAEAAQSKAEEAAQGVSDDREQIGANKSGLEAAQQELTAAKEQLAETKATLATTQADLKKAQRAIQFQAELNKGQTWDFEVDTQEAYQRQVPSGAKAGAVMEWGGKTVAWNQLCRNAELANLDGFVAAGSSVLTVADGIITANCRGSYPGVKSSGNNCMAAINHYYYIATTAKIEVDTTYFTPYFDSDVFGSNKTAIGTGAFVRSGIIRKAIKSGPAHIGSRIRTRDNGEYTGVLQMKHPVFIDLTLLYGSGNEPTDTSDPRIAKIEAYAAKHPEYNGGELVSALVDSVVERGANLINIQALQAWWPNDTEVDGDILYVKKNSGGANGIVDKRFPISIPSGAVISAKGVKPRSNMVMSKNARLSFVLANGQILECFLSDKSNTPKEVENVVASNDIIAVYLDYTTPDNFFGIANLMIRLPYASSTYSPYHQETYPIPSAVQALPGYGWSAGSVANTVERTENGWQYVQRVGSRAYQDGDELTDGTTTYYELATPITTDITALMGDSLAPFAVEAGGSITMHHPKADEGFAIDVPAKIQYITKLSEVSANG